MAKSLQIRPSLRDKQKELTLQLLRQAARGAFYSRPYEEVSMEDIAREAGVSRGTVYLHFSGKLDVLNDLLRDDLADQMGVYDELAEARRTTVGQMREWLQHFHDQMMRRGPSLHLHALYLRRVPEDSVLVLAHREGAIAKLGQVYPGFNLSALSGEARERKRVEIYLMLLQIEQAALTFGEAAGTPDLALGLDILAERLLEFANRG